MTDDCFDIAVVGVGPAGMTAALMLARQGLSTVAIGPDISATETRTAALLGGSIRLMQWLGVWDDMERAGTPLKTMRLIDDTGRLLRAPTVDFHAEEIGEPWFGVNVPVKDISSVLLAAADAEPLLSRRPEQVEATETGDGDVTLSLASGEKLRTRLVVAADGRLSVCRACAGIGTRQQRYPQSALVLSLDHERDHDFVSTEFHRRAGPFTLVPLPGRRSSLVCVVTPEDAAELDALDHASLGARLTEMSKSILGRLTPASPRRIYPLGSQTADRFAAGRTLLIGEAAHVMPPIGAQGLNLGLRDVASIADALNDRNDLDDPARVVDAYHSARSLDIRTRMTAVDLLNRSLLSGFFAFQGARSLGLHALRGFGPLRRLAMREGITPSYATPSLMKG